MKSLFIGVFMSTFACNIAAQKQHDSLAILLIDRMTDVIGDLESCAFNLQVAKDSTFPDLGMVKRFIDFEVFMSGPDKMMINYQNDRGHRQIWYNGAQLAYYFKDEHNYGIIPAPLTTIEMIDSVHKAYHIEFPAADFFYPGFTDDLLANFDQLRYLGRSQLNGQEYFHIMAENKEQNMQIWISTDSYNLPGRFAITYLNRPGNPQYQASFSNWRINPNLPAAMFNFEPPPGSAKVRIMSATDR